MRLTFFKRPKRVIPATTTAITIQGNLLMVAALGNDWKDNEDLRLGFVPYRRLGINRQNILDYVKRDYPQDTWSLRTLCCRLAHFNINITDHSVSIEQVKDAVRKELNGPARELGYSALHHKIRQEHSLDVPRDLLQAVMTELSHRDFVAEQ